MSRQKNDGRGRMGGRQQGTPNKINSDLKAWITDIINNGKEQFISDLANLSPMERIKIYVGLLNYIIPKQQAIQAEVEPKQQEPGITVVVRDEHQAELIRKVENL